MKTKMNFFFRGIAATVLMLFFTSFAMAANTSNHAVNKMSKAKTTMVNDTGTGMDFTASIKARDLGNFGNDQQKVVNFTTNNRATELKMEKSNHGAKDVSMRQNQAVVNVTDVGTLRFKKNVDMHQAVPIKISCNHDVSLKDQDLRNRTENQSTESYEATGNYLDLG